MSLNKGLIKAHSTDIINTPQSNVGQFSFIYFFIPFLLFSWREFKWLEQDPERVCAGRVGGGGEGKLAREQEGMM